MSRIIGLDVGTLFFQVAELNSDDSIGVKNIRNAFVELPLDESVEEVLSRNDWQWIKDGDKVYVLGEDSIKVANIFPGSIELRRPMQAGVLNKDEDKKMLVLAEMIQSSIGDAPDSNSVVCTCVSSAPVDESQDSAFHKARLSGMISRLGYHVKVIDEGLAVVLSERPTVIEDGEEVPYSGLGISFGAGRSNCVLAYKGLQIIGMSVSRGGDFIDRKVSEATDTPVAQVIRVKERKLNFEQLNIEDDILFALDTYYNELIRFVFEKFSSEFAKVKSQFEYPLEIIVAGGTSCPPGFCGKVENVLHKLQLPFDIKCVKHAQDPKNAVVKGLLTSAIITHKRMQKG